MTDLPHDIALLAAQRHHDPHTVLGVHPTSSGYVVRAWRPMASSVALIIGSGELPMHRVGDALYAANVATFPESYTIRTTYGDGQVHESADPYRFAPTIGELDLHLMGEGRHRELWRVLGAHVRVIDGVSGTSFAVWAPSARAVSVVGSWNGWNPVAHPMRTMGASGVWELFVPGVGAGAQYKFEVRSQHGSTRGKADPLAQRTEAPPRTASVVTASAFEWTDAPWIDARPSRETWREAMSIYEVHLGSWRRNPDQGNRSLTYVEHAVELIDYVVEMGFTHIELLPITEHPFGGSWGYQCTGYFAPTARFGDPDDFRALVNAAHAAGIGVILDWVPAHFPRDDHGLACFDGTALYEHADPRRGAHPDWGTLIFNYGRNEVRNFLLASALYWLEDMHVDGLRVDAVASMLYLDYSRNEGEWIPNIEGGREDLDAIVFLRDLNEVTHAASPGIAMCAEESTAWPGVSRPTSSGGLGFDFKWNMGWMHDTLHYFQNDPVHRLYHHHELTFGLLYAFSEQYILPLSHDEVVHGKGSLLGKMPGDRWQQFANLRALYGWMWAHPGKKLLFMGSELAQPTEWNHDESLPWHLRDVPEHAGVQRLVRDLNAVYRNEPALWRADSEESGFAWLEAADGANNVLAFCRFGDDATPVVCVANLSPVVRDDYRIGMPLGGTWRQVVNTDDPVYGGAGVDTGPLVANGPSWHGQDQSIVMRLPPLASVWLMPR